MSEKNSKQNLPSTNTSVVNTGDERNGAKGTKKDNSSVVNTGAEKDDVPYAGISTIAFLVYCCGGIVLLFFISSVNELKIL